jgi:heme/copper-type cytochrome/quinol oxidase subunit 3
MTDAVPAVEVVGDVSGLPDHRMGAGSVVWWGTFGFMLLEGSGFLLAAGAYLYMVGQTPRWPPPGDSPPGLLAGAVFTAALVASQVPNLWLEARAKRQSAAATRWGALAMTLIGVALSGLRAWELFNLNVRWSHDAYGSLVWLLMVLHTTHILTDLGDTAVITLWLFTHEPGGSQYADVVDNCGYWTFVVATWLPLYLLVYWGPRWL